jgi:single-stranded DNA-specific DHH superfamily exonuclease
LAERAAAAVRLIAGMPPRRRVLVLADADVDGVAAAAILARTLARLGLRFVVRLSRRRDPAFLDALIAEEPALLITADLGASFVPRLKQAHVPAIVLDHHEPAGDGDGETVVHVNPHLVGGRAPCRVRDERSGPPSLCAPGCVGRPLPWREP